MEFISIPCDTKRLGHLVAIIGCHDKEMVGCEFVLCGRVKKWKRILGKYFLAQVWNVTFQAIHALVANIQAIE